MIADLNNLKKVLKSVLESKYLDSLAIKEEFILRTRKITGSNFVYSLIFLLSSGAINLRKIKESVFFNGDISREAINKKFNNKSVRFFKKIFINLIKNELSFGKKINTIFSDIKILDSSYFLFHNGLINIFPHIGIVEKSGAKMQLFYSYLKNGIFNVEFKKSRMNDQSYVRYVLKHLNKGELFLADKAYLVINFLIKLNKKGVYFVGGYNKQNIYKRTINKKDKRRFDYEKIDIIEYLSGRKGNFREEFYMYNSKKESQKLKISLVFFKLSEEKSNLNRMNAKKNAKKNNKSKTPTKITLALAGWRIYITNIEADVLSLKDIASIYRVRWQVELIFKNYKSIMKLDKYNVKSNKYRVKTEFYANMIIFIIADKTFNSLKYITDKEMSFYKFTSLFEQYIPFIAQAINKNFNAFFKVIKVIIELALKSSGMGIQKSRKTTAELLDGIGSLS